MTISTFDSSHFEHGYVKFAVHTKPVSLQNDGAKRAAFKKELQKITSQSEYIITGTCWIAIDYYCQHVRREKNPGVYDIDNIVKPILDGLTGERGLIVDDVVVNRVTVNWIDSPHDDWFEVEIEYPDLLFSRKADLVFLKSPSGWCFPSTNALIADTGYMVMVRRYFATWDSISSEDEYYESVYDLPIQNFIYYVKIRDKGFQFVELCTVDGDDLDSPRRAY
ncbi:RusA family crossover junction endodeoxyribonuclease [Methylomonas sp. SURF-1]|uniref:RusA family crossover junction endodeoxyribonuclease n=1 Tax=Methylomonas aurea TaxID=2952224 RepID=A0ABT1UIC4_9GAMM|nr:RusA family crossover junction endodeoxyribonuclease [Methylomonas sp. SURF-1]MCQ8181766.1 RusA family crossover junction endodeoxyribonuclease [Methylomonas sp. SURF-1]